MLIGKVGAVTSVLRSGPNIFVRISPRTILLQRDDLLPGRSIHIVVNDHLDLPVRVIIIVIFLIMNNGNEIDGRLVEIHWLSIFEACLHRSHHIIISLVPGKQLNPPLEIPNEKSDVKKGRAPSYYRGMRLAAVVLDGTSLGESVCSVEQLLHLIHIFNLLFILIKEIK